MTIDLSALWKSCSALPPVYKAGGKGKSDVAYAIGKVTDGEGAVWQVQFRAYRVGSKYNGMSEQEVKVAKTTATIARLGLTAAELKAIAGKLPAHS